MFNFYNNRFNNNKTDTSKILDACEANNNKKETSFNKNSQQCGTEQEIQVNEVSNLNVNNNKFNNVKANVSANDFEELQKARQDLIGEIQAVIEYDNHAYKSTNNVAKNTWLNIKSEEIVHVGELLALIDYLDDSQRKFVQEGINEFNERLNNK